MRKGGNTMKSSPRKIWINIKSEWSGWINNQPVTIILTLHECTSDYELWQWNWIVFAYWQSEYAINKKLRTGPLWVFDYGQMMDKGLLESPNPRRFTSETEAFRFAERWLNEQGFQFLKDL
jgi:hypothetical protein